MHRYSPVRNPRSKGIKIKHVLRICFLISVCCWLIFQIKRSHYKKNDLESVDTDTNILSRKNSVDDIVKLGRKDVRPKETMLHEEEKEEGDDDEREFEEKDDEIDENEQYKLDDEEDASEAREEQYKADDASSAVPDENEDQILDTSKFLEHENEVQNGAKIQETGFESANVSSNHKPHGSGSTRVVEESETSLKSTNMSAVVDPLTMLTAKEVETEEDLDEVQHDAIDLTDIIGLEELDNSEDTVAE